ncbi:acyl carrier protein [Nocardia sp. alder85J]|uniref:acyl carrier protein n=1 Tax=Nocardia sp. alder85J TaxID=2862949 RepID=UPI001CD49CF6|nr:acyl carrier protein [Nocardia sp. alder85J]MCX4097452.1 acyl carrier protein [Nocardia sp. alder85J]
MAGVRGGSAAARIRSLITALAPDARHPVTDESRLVEDLGFDCLRLTELAMVLEHAFDLPRYGAEELAGVSCVADVIALITGQRP